MKLSLICKCQVLKMIYARTRLNGFTNIVNMNYAKMRRNGFISTVHTRRWYGLTRGARNHLAYEIRPRTARNIYATR